MSDISTIWTEMDFPINSFDSNLNYLCSFTQYLLFKLKKNQMQKLDIVFTLDYIKTTGKNLSKTPGSDDSGVGFHQVV